MKEHVCPTCREKDPTQFWKDSRKGAHGLQTYCKKCSREKRKQWADANNEKLYQYNKDRYQQIRKDPTRWEDKLRQNARYRRKHRYHTQVHWNNHRARTHYKQMDSIRVTEWLELLAQHPERCPGCQQYWNLVGSATMDHIRPLILKGVNRIENIQPLCRSCNVTKSKRIMNFIREKRKEQQDG